MSTTEDHKLNQSRRFGRLYLCCISSTQVFNKIIWFIPLKVNNFGHKSAAWCAIWEQYTPLQMGDKLHDYWALLCVQRDMALGFLLAMLVA